MENSPEFASFKKVVIFGSEGSGKTSLVKMFEKGKFTDETHSESGKLKYYIIFLK